MPIKLDKEIKKQIMSLPDVISIGICMEIEPTVVIEVKKGRGTLDIPFIIENKKVRIVEVDDAPIVEFDTDPSLYRNEVRPLRPGLMISNGSAGFYVEHNQENYLITVAHLVNSFDPNRLFYQPVSLERYHIGQMHARTDIYGGGVAEADAMAVKLNNIVPFTNELLELPKKPVGLVEPELNTDIINVGYRTGMRKGKITAVDVFTALKERDGSTWYLDNGFRTDSESQPGDSGGCILTENPCNVVGIHVGAGNGITIASPATIACEELGFGRYPKLAEKTLTKIELEINGKAYINGEEIPIDEGAFIRNGRTFVPLRFIAEAFGAKIDWEPKDGVTEKIFVEF